MSKEEGFELSIDALEKLCDEHGLLLSDPLLNLVTDVIVMVLNKDEEK
jgi:hypothetical protein|tara:strand:- start:1344 stop:1487 length:144 start_codon:yes stop_codon:yes gene_type:complete